MKKRVCRGIQTRHLLLPNLAGTPRIPNVQDTNASALQDAESACHGQNQEVEKTPTAELKIFLSICFDKKFLKNERQKLILAYLKSCFSEKLWLYRPHQDLPQLDVSNRLHWISSQDFKGDNV